MRIAEQQSTFEYVKSLDVIPIPFPAHLASHREGTLRIAFPLNGRVPYTFAGSGLRVGIPSDESRTSVGLRCDVYCVVCGENAARMDYEPSTWRGLARAVHDKQVPRDHNTCVTIFADVVANERQGIFAGRIPGAECDSAPS